MVEPFIDVKSCISPVHIGLDFNIVDLFNPELAAQVNYRDLVPIGVFVGEIDLNTIVAFTVPDCTEHLIIYGFTFQEDGDLLIF